MKHPHLHVVAAPPSVGAAPTQVSSGEPLRGPVPPPVCPTPRELPCPHTTLGGLSRSPSPARLLPRVKGRTPLWGLWPPLPAGWPGRGPADLEGPRPPGGCRLGLRSMGSCSPGPAS